MKKKQYESNEKIDKIFKMIFQTVTFKNKQILKMQISTVLLPFIANLLFCFAECRVNKEY